MDELRALQNLAYVRYCTQVGISRNHPDLRTMPYPEFLASAYWKVLRSRLLVLRGGACESCRARAKVELHHRTYEHRGFEYWFPGDLIFLCAACHDVTHEVWRADRGSCSG